MLMMDLDVASIYTHLALNSTSLLLPSTTKYTPQIYSFIHSINLTVLTAIPELHNTACESPILKTVKREPVIKAPIAVEPQNNRFS